MCYRQRQSNRNRGVGNDVLQVQEQLSSSWKCYQPRSHAELENFRKRAAREQALARAEACLGGKVPAPAYVCLSANATR